MAGELVERLRAGPIRTGDSENGQYELYDIEGDAEAMYEAAGELTALDEGWAGSTCQRDRIVDWFGPSDFRSARRALSEPDNKEGT